MADGLLTGLSSFLFGKTDNSQYLQEYARQAMAAEEARQREAQAYAQQQRYAQYLQSVMNGASPSLAQLQLMQGLGAIQQQQQGMAAGVGGPGAALARYGAAVNSADAGAAANQSAALARVAELNSARQAFGANANAMAANSGNMYRTSLGGAEGFGQLGSGVAAQNIANNQKLGGAIAQGIGAAAGMYFGSTPSGQSQPQSDGTYNADTSGYTIQGNQLFDPAGNPKSYGTG